MTQILSIDYGIKNIGFAYGNTQFNTINILPHLNRKFLNNEEVYQEVIKKIEFYNIQNIVIGIPLLKSHVQTQTSKIVIQFRDFLKSKLINYHKVINIISYNEYLSSYEAKKIFNNLSKKKKLSTSIDSIAASIILQGYYTQLDNSKLK